MAPGDDATDGADGHDGDVLDSSAAGPLALRGSVMRVGGYGGGMLLALISAPLLVRHLHQVGYGRYVTALSIATIAVNLTEGGVSTIAVRDYASRSRPERNSALANLLGIRLLLSTLGILAAFGFAAVAGYDSAIVIGTMIASVGVSLQVVQMLVSVPLQTSMRLGWVAAADLVRNAVSTVLIVALVLSGAGIVPLLAVTVPAYLAALLLTVALVRGLMPLRPRFRLAAYMPLLREVLPFAVAIALSSIYFRLTVVVMSLEASPLQTGYFSTSFRVVEILIGLPALVIGAAYPIITRAARDDPARFAYATRRMFELSVLVGVWVAVATVLIAPFAMAVLGGAAARPAAPVLRIQGVAVMGTFIAVACGFPLLSLRRYPALLVANGLGLVVTLVVSLSLVPVLAAHGAAIATVAAELTLAAVSAAALAYAQPQLRLPFEIVPIAVAVGGVALGAGYLLGIHPVLDAAVATGVYALLLAAVGRFPPEIGHMIRMERSTGTAG